MVARLPALLALCAAAVSVSANPLVVRDSLVSLSIARRVNLTGTADVLKADQARAKVLQANSQGAARSENALAKFLDSGYPVTNKANGYTASVGVGIPPQYFNLIVDTGSANTWVGANKIYVPGPSATLANEGTTVSYGSGFYAGDEYYDTITLGDVTIKNQSFGDAILAYGFDTVDGILGIGPVDLTINTTYAVETVPTVLDNLFTQHTIKSEIIGISFEPANGTAATNGELTFGGVDPHKYIGEINYVPITSTYPASRYVGITQSITYGPFGTTILEETAGITDTGTTLVLLATNAYDVYKNITGAVPDTVTGLLQITQEQYYKLESLYFHIGHNTYELTPNAQIWPRALNTAIGGVEGNIYLIVGDIGTIAGQGLDFIDGFSFLERHYYVYDVEHHRVGLAQTVYTYAESN